MTVEWSALNGTSITPLQSPGKEGPENVGAEEGDKHCGTLSSGQDITVTLLMNSQQVRLPAEDLHKIKTAKIPV